MTTVRKAARTAILILLALALAALGGILVSRADGPVLWKAHCPAHYSVSTVPVPWPEGGGVHVVCTRAAREEAGGR